MCVIFVFLFENSQNSYSCGPPFGPLWSGKYHNLGQKLAILTAHHTFLESRHSEVTKNPYFVLSPRGSQKKVSTHGITLENVKLQWDGYIEILVKTNTTEVSRKLIEFPNPKAIELHEFSDGSLKYYRAYIYLTATLDDKIPSKLFWAKSRVAPLTKASVPA